MKYILRQFPTNKSLVDIIEATLLKPDVTENEMMLFIHDVEGLGFWHIVIPLYYLPLVRKSCCISTALGTVIGFPFGYNTNDIKNYEAALAVKNGAQEIDMVINIAALKTGYLKKVEQEIQDVREIIDRKILKVILETCYLNENEIKEASLIAQYSGADYIKTSTGYGTRGATVHDINIIKSTVGIQRPRIKASGGIKTIYDVSKMVRAGASRIGTSRPIGILEEYTYLQFKDAEKRRKNNGI